MALSSLPNSIHFPTSFSISSFNTTSLHTPNTYLPPSLSTKRRLSLDIKCHDGTESKKKVNSNNSDDDDDDDDTIETISKLYKYAKKKDVVHLTKEVAIQHPEIFNSIRFLQVNMKMWNLVSNIIRGFQDSLVFSVQPTVKDGSTVGIKWKVGWDKPLMGSKKGVTIHSHHSYVGKLLIGNFGTLLDPLLQLAPMRMMKGDGVSKSKEKRIASMCLGLFLLLVSLFCFQFSIR